MEQYQKTILEIQEALLKKVKKSRRLSIFLLFVGCFFIIYSTTILIINILSNMDIFTIIFDIILIFIWIFQLFLNSKTLKNNNKLLKSVTNDYYKYLKEFDYPSFIKEQRTKKLKKIKFI